MKKLVLAFVVVAFCLPAFGQQIPLYSQYNVNQFVFNPAKTGQRGDFRLNLLYRTQWTDFEGAPETRALTIDGAIQDDRAGLGAYIYSDITNMVERLGGHLSYAYHIRLGEDDHRLSLGLAGGIVQTSIDFDRAVVTDSEDPLLRDNLDDGIAFDASVGVNYQLKNWQLGFAVPQLLETNIEYINTDEPLNYQLSRHYLAHTSYNIPLKKDVFYFEPMVLFRAAEGDFSDFQVDAGGYFKFKEIAWLGAMYRYDYAVTVGAGVQVHDRISVGYAYDLSTNELSDYSGGSHEIMVGIKFGKREDKGLLEELNNRVNRIDSVQRDQAVKIESVETKNDSIIQQNEEFKQKIEQQQEQIEQLKQEINKTIQEFKDSIRQAVPGASGRAMNGYDSKGRPIPDDLVQEVDWEDVEFIYGKSDDPYFMIVASHRNARQAKNHADELEKKGHKVGVVYNTERKWYYVFLEKPGDLKSGLKELYELRANDPDFSDAWIHVYK